MTARKAATKPQPDAVIDTPDVSVTPDAVQDVSVTEPPPVLDPPPAPEVQAAEPVYIAARRMQRNGEVIKIGDVLPDAASWPRLESWIRAGYVKEAS